MSAPEAASPEEEKGPCATRAEKVAAFRSLIKEDYARLLKFAEWTARKFEGKVNDSDAEDLLHAALLTAVERNWYPQRADFLTYLRGCIRSQADNWYKSAKATELPDEVVSPFRHDARTEAVMELERIRSALKSRPNAVEILDLKCSGMKAKEIQERLGISKNIYAAAVKWIERKLREEGLRP